MKRFLQHLLGRKVRGDSASGKLEKEQQPGVTPFLPEGRRLYCIGDIHGRLDLLEELHHMIRQDAADFSGSKAVVYLGDYVDRGSQSCQVLDLLVSQPLTGFEMVYLLGNHEQAMLDFLKQPRSAAAWLTYGGQGTLLSYGVGLGKLVISQDPGSLCAELEQKLPQSHLDFLNDCQLVHTEGSYCFVHAGIRPGVPLADQQMQDMLWIREDFTRSRSNHEHIVVHGHTISDEVEWLPNRIGIDTGAYETGLLTALVLEGQEQRLLQTK